jgi:hypothetical protein
MEIRFYCVHNSKKFYNVVLHGEEIFCGTKEECQQFIKTHNQKVRRSLGEVKNPPRPKPGNVRVYRRRIESSDKKGDSKKRPEKE